MNYWPYQKLIIWQKAMDLTQETYRLVKFLPAEERYALSDQMRRAAVSVPSNIAEGHGRHTEKEFKQFLSVETDIKWIGIFEILYYCGLRRGELRGLQWKDINFKDVHDLYLLIKS